MYGHLQWPGFYQPFVATIGGSWGSKSQITHFYVQIFLILPILSKVLSTSKSHDLSANKIKAKKI